MNRSLETKTALLVEDEAATRNLIARHLGRKGMVVTAVESGEAARSAAASAPFDVLISDVHLPGMSGLDLATQLLAANPRQPVVLMTGDPDEALAREALSRGPVGYLLKPFEMAELESAVEQAVARLAAGPAGELTAPAELGRVPLQWLDMVDQSSHAGRGHARRVARLAMALAEAARPLEERLQVGDLVLAAWSHELGRLRQDASDPVRIATEGARMLEDLGCAPGVVEGVRHLHERYDGTGGPGQLAAEAIPAISLLLAVADALDHFAAAWQLAGRDPTEAVDRALGLIRVQSGTVFSPAAVEGAYQQRKRLASICSEVREIGGGDGRMAGVA